MDLKLKMPAEQTQLANMIPRMFSEARINDSEHIVVHCWMRCLNRSNQPALSRGWNEALSSRRLVSVDEMRIVSSSKKAKIKNQLQPLWFSRMLLLDVVQPRQEIFDLSTECVCVCCKSSSCGGDVMSVGGHLIHHRFSSSYSRFFLQIEANINGFLLVWTVLLTPVVNSSPISIIQFILLWGLCVLLTKKEFGLTFFFKKIESLIIQTKNCWKSFLECFFFYKTFFWKSLFFDFFFLIFPFNVNPLIPSARGVIMQKRLQEAQITPVAAH